MKKKLTALIAFLVTGLVLVGCSVTVEPATPPPIQVTATDDVAPEPLATVSQNRTIEVTVPGSLDGDLVVFEAEGPGTKRIVVRDADGNIIGGSSSPYYFVPESGFSALSDFNAEMDTQATVESICFGPCVIVPASSATKKYTVEVRTNGTSDFYAYASEYGDESEPFNNAESSAFGLSDGDAYLGAFETLYDVDYFWTTGNDQVSIVTYGDGYNHGLVLFVEVIYLPGDDWVLLDPSEHANFTVFTGSQIRITPGGGYAGSFDASRYRISVEH